VDLTDPAKPYLRAPRPDVSFELLRIDWGDLQRAGLVENSPIPESGRDGYAKFITEYGLRFDSFVRMPYDDVHPPS
jgi:hypothetical protein